jgi:hypothetical protein
MQFFYRNESKKRKEKKLSFRLIMLYDTVIAMLMLATIGLNSQDSMAESESENRRPEIISKKESPKYLAQTNVKKTPPQTALSCSKSNLKTLFNHHSASHAIVLIPKTPLSLSLSLQCPRGRRR